MALDLDREGPTLSLDLEVPGFEYWGYPWGALIVQYLSYHSY